MRPILPGWQRIANSAEGEYAYMHKESGLYALVSRDNLEMCISITKQGNRPNLTDCRPCLHAFQMLEAREVKSVSGYRRFALPKPAIFKDQVSLF